MTNCKNFHSRYVLRAMEDHCLNGDAYVAEDILYHRCKERQRGLSYATFKADLAEQIRLGYIHPEGSHLYINRTWRYEEDASKQLVTILRQPTLPAMAVPENLSVNGIALCQEQRAAVELALTNKLSLILGGAGCAMAEWILRMISTPEDIFDLALTYLYIYFAGTPAIMLYNYGAAALRARGDTQRPLLFLTISGVTNVALNLLFVISFQMDVAGVALATVISETLSAVLVVVCLMRTQDELHFSWRKLRFDRRSLGLMAKVGIPAGVQGCLFSVANVVIQGAINAYGSVVVAGCSAAGSIDGFIYVAMNTFHQSAQTFLSQNIGAGKYERVKEILKKCVLCTVVTGATLSAVACIWSEPLLAIYNQDPAVLAAGAVRLRMVVIPYVIFGIADVLTGAIRGCGSPMRPVVINLLCTCVFRLAWIAAIDTDTMAPTWVYASYPASWLLLLVVLLVCWCRLYRRKIKPNIARNGAAA